MDIRIGVCILRDSDAKWTSFVTNYHNTIIVALFGALGYCGVEFVVVQGDDHHYDGAAPPYDSMAHFIPLKSLNIAVIPSKGVNPPYTCHADMIRPGRHGG